VLDDINLGYGPDYTKKRWPATLVFKLLIGLEMDALSVQNSIKHYKLSDKLALIDCYTKGEFDVYNKSEVVS